jgi:biopolymer transport protein ExbB/TolQ
MERQISELSSKIKTLKFRRSKTSEILKKRDRQASERQKESIINISKAVNELKETIEEKKFAKGEDDQTVAEWSKQYESELEEADEDITTLDQQIKEIDNNERERKTAYEHEKNLAFELEFQEGKISGRVKKIKTR